jgi:hypothetical protein
MAEPVKDAPVVEDHTATGQEVTTNADSEVEKLKAEVQTKTSEIESLHSKVKQLQDNEAK